MYSVLTLNTIRVVVYRTSETFAQDKTRHIIGSMHVLAGEILLVTCN